MNLLFLLLAALAQDPPKPDKAPVEQDEVRIEGSKETPIDKITAPTHELKEEDLLRFEYDDIHRVLRQVPGVYMREEDGYGLRPNIGMRGTSTERSSKVTLMEDGILFGPAPYAAPAAYYFPMSTRMVGVETVMGPQVLHYGPLTVGGALQMRTRPVPDRFTGGADLAVGSFGYRKAHLWAGHEIDLGGSAIGFLAEGVHVRSDGFKDLDGGGDTGFAKSEILLKGGYRVDGHRFAVKLGYGEEESDETYLGLTDADFDEDPYRRYAGSQLDRMEWDRVQIELFHEVDLAPNLVLETALYHHDFARVWGKLNRFRNGPELNTLLANPTAGTNAVFYQVLTGQIDSSNTDEHLMIGTNDREFISQGIQTGVRWAEENDRGRIERALRAGLRLHRDEAVRLHTEDAYRMVGGRLVFNGDPRLVNTDTTASAEAVALYASYTQRFGSLLVTPILRGELIRTEFEDHATGADDAETNGIVLPGLDAAYEVDEQWTVRAGVYRGFSPKAPGQAEEVDPEESINYEIGVLFAAERTSLSVTAFFNDYENLTAEDTFSSGGGGTGEQFNGGEVRIFGVEVGARSSPEVATGLWVPLGLAYTFLASEFQSTFSSDNPQFGDVEDGDELPYLPEHQLTASAGLQGETWQAVLLANYVGWMREEAGRGDPIDYLTVPARTVVDVSASWNFFPRQRVYLNVRNLLGEEYVVSHRPYGARPGLPREIVVGLELGF